MEEKVKYRDYSYQVLENGYLVFDRLGNLKHKQMDPFGHVFVQDGSYEDNAKAQIDSFYEEQAEVKTVEAMYADLEYMALMLDIDLPSEEEGV